LNLVINATESGVLNAGKAVFISSPSSPRRCVTVLTARCSRQVRVATPYTVNHKKT